MTRYVTLFHFYVSFLQKRQPKKKKKKTHKNKRSNKIKNKNKKSRETLVYWDFKSHVGNLNFGQILKIHVGENVCGNMCNIV